MSNGERPEARALRELEEVAERVAEELAAFRMRAQKAEAAQAESEERPDAVGAQQRIGELEKENRDLRQRVETSRERVGELLHRLEFLEAQMTTDVAPP